MIWDHKHTLEEMARVDEFRQTMEQLEGVVLMKTLKSLNGFTGEARALCEKWNNQMTTD